MEQTFTRPQRLLLVPLYEGGLALVANPCPSYLHNRPCLSRAFQATCAWSACYGFLH